MLGRHELRPEGASFFQPRATPSLLHTSLESRKVHWPKAKYRETLGSLPRRGHRNCSHGWSVVAALSPPPTRNPWNKAEKPP